RANVARGLTNMGSTRSKRQARSGSDEDSSRSSSRFMTIYVLVKYPACPTAVLRGARQPTISEGWVACHCRSSFDNLIEEASTDFTDCADFFRGILTELAPCLIDTSLKTVQRTATQNVVHCQAL